MKYSEEGPKLPKLPFVIGDLLLIATAAFIALRSPAPIGPGPLLAVTVCVVFGAALLVVPFLANYARRQDAALTDRQNEIAALARTTAESAEQLGIAAAGLHTIGESSKQNLDTLNQLPAQLQERIDTLTRQLAGSTIASQASLKEDLAQLEAAAEKIARTLAKLEATTQAKSDTLATVENGLTDALARATTQIDAFATATAARLAALPPAVITAVSPLPVATAEDPVTTSADQAVSPPAEVKPKPATTPKPKTKAAAALSSPPTPKEEPVPVSAEPAPAANQSVPSDPLPLSPEPASIVVTPEPVAPVAAAEPVSEPLPEPVTAAEPFAPAEPDAAEVPVDEPAEPKPPRARRARAADGDAGFDLGLTSDTTEPTESSVTSDGFTRLIATAYIGIGNKLYIRGDGPGLSWEKGIPLQFVSIGKWRWETPDATAPITVKLYKNDQVECLGLGSLKIEPGRQHEVNAGF